MVTINSIEIDSMRNCRLTAHHFRCLLYWWRIHQWSLCRKKYRFSPPFDLKNNLKLVIMIINHQNGLPNRSDTPLKPYNRHQSSKTKPSMPLTWLFGWWPFSNLRKATPKDARKFEFRDFLIFHTNQFGFHMLPTWFCCNNLFSFDIILDSIFSVTWFWADNIIEIQLNRTTLGRTMRFMVVFYLCIGFLPSR